MQINNYEDASALYALALHFLNDEEKTMLKEYMQQYPNTANKHAETIEDAPSNQAVQEHYRAILNSDSFSQLESEE